MRSSTLLFWEKPPKHVHNSVDYKNWHSEVIPLLNFRELSIWLNYGLQLALKCPMSDRYFTVLHGAYIEITAWLANAYDFHARVARSERVSLAIFHNKCIIKIVQTSQPRSNLFMSNI